MSHVNRPSNGRYTIEFTSVAAGEVHVAGLPLGSAGSPGTGRTLFSSIAAMFQISPDVLPYLRALAHHGS